MRSSESIGMNGTAMNGGLIAALSLFVLCIAELSFAQPIDPATASGPYCGGGLSLSGDDIRRIASVDESGPRGGVGNVLIVECNGAFGYSTIQSAVDDAVDGDVVVILPNDCTAEGRWFENVEIVGKSIRVQSANPADEGVVAATVVEGGSFSTIEVTGAPDTDVQIQGMTIVSDWIGINADQIRLSVNQIRSIDTQRSIVCNMCSNVSIRDSLFSDIDSAIYLNSCGENQVSNCSFVDVSGCIAFLNYVDDVVVASCQFVGVSRIGIFLNDGEQSGDVLIEACQFHDFASPENATLSSRAISAAIRPNAVVIRDCLFARCETAGSFYSVVSANAGLLHIENSAFIDNGTDNAPFRNATPPLVHSLAAQLEVINSLFVRNSNMCIYTSSAPLQIESCQFVGNSDGVVWTSSDDIHFNQTLLARNKSQQSQFLLLLGSEQIRIGNSSLIHNSGQVWFSDFSTSIENTVFQDSPFTLVRSGGSSGPRDGLIVQYSCIDVLNSVLAEATEKEIDISTIESRSGEVGFGEQSSGFWNSVGNYDSESAKTTFELNDVVLLPDQFRDLVIQPIAGVNDWTMVAGNTESTISVWGDFSDYEIVPGVTGFVIEDYRLAPDSPCIDAGDPEFVPEDGATDLAGMPRVMSCRVDMGAYEFVQEYVAVPGDLTGDGAVTLEDIPLFATLTLGPEGSEVCIGDLTGDGRTDGRDIAALTALVIGD